MWEHFTTKPFIPEISFIDHVLTPWSSWLIVASATLLASPSHVTILNNFLTNLSESIKKFDAPDARKKDSKEFVVGHFGYEEKDVEAWLETVRYPLNGVREVKKDTIFETLT